mmetsp:Transcript_28722/g.61642  ORF Transcript_28722/g.61642 Transcript_28722/m.61642 type:complete len:217 (-) Transcript_28722:426-1076(-)
MSASSVPTNPRIVSNRLLAFRKSLCLHSGWHRTIPNGRLDAVANSRFGSFQVSAGARASWKTISARPIDPLVSSRDPSNVRSTIATCSRTNLLAPATVSPSLVGAPTAGTPRETFVPGAKWIAILPKVRRQTPNSLFRWPIPAWAMFLTTIADATAFTSVRVFPRRFGIVQFPRRFAKRKRALGTIRFWNSKPSRIRRAVYAMLRMWIYQHHRHHQ